MRAGSCLSIGLFVSIHALAGCTESGSPDTGELSINLVGQAPSGAVYRLRDATVVVDGPLTHRVFDTEEDLTRTTLEENVVTGDYSARLEPGWRLERVEGASTTTVEAEHTSPNPALFAVADNQRTFVPLKFHVAGEQINLAQGYGVIIEIDEGVCGNGILEGVEQCDDGNTNQFDACNNTCFTALATEIEPNEDGTPSPFGAFLTGNDFATANADLHGAIPVNGDTFQRAVAKGSLNPLGDEDVYAIENITASEKLVVVDTFAVNGQQCDNGADTVLVLRDAGGTVLSVNNDRNGALDRCSQITFMIHAGGRFYVQVLSPGDGSSISYILAVASH